MTPRRTTLTTVPGLRGLHRAVAGLCESADVSVARATIVLVPTRVAAGELRHTLENIWLGDSPRHGAEAPCNDSTARAVFLPDVLTRGDWYRRLAESLASDVRVLSDIEREVLLGASAREAAASGTPPPFRMRPALVAEMLRFYDTLRRQEKSLADFERLLLEDLEPRSEFDRGAERLLRQTRFLAAAFRRFEERVEAVGGVDEHGVRQRALAAAPSNSASRRVIVTVGDRVSDPSSGLYPADFDLLARVPHLESIDFVFTRTALLAGLGERLRRLMPGIEERESAEGNEAGPSLSTPPSRAGRLHFESRDREEELRDIARRVKRSFRDAATASPVVPAPRVAVVFRRPLPYVYLGRTTFDAAGVQSRVSDALPLAAEPFAAALDVVFAAVTARFGRRPLLQLLRSPHFRFASEDVEPSAAEIGALDRALAESGYLGNVERLRAFTELATGQAAVAARAALAIADELVPLSSKAAASSHLARILAFLQKHERPPAVSEELLARHLRARGAVLTILEDLRAAAAAHDDAVVGFEDVAASVRRWIEAQTFTPARGDGGVRLLDAQSARYGDFDHVHLAGLVAGDWPEASAHDIFYPPFLLSRLGWPPETERLAAERAAFADLLRLAHHRVAVSSFTLEDDGIVEPSPLLEDLERAGLTAEPAEDEAPARVFVDDALAMESTLEGDRQPDGWRLPLAWLALRSSRTAAADPAFHGCTQGPGARPGARGYTVTGLDRYLDCPFKYFASVVLKLPEEQADEQGLSPKERGRFVHEVFRAFFAEWQARGGRAIGVDQLEEARALFRDVAEAALTTLPASEAALERLRLLGSVAAPGLGEVALAAEAERSSPVSRRLLEFAFDGEFELSADAVTRPVRLRGKADRVDILQDARLRIIDYKIGRPPEDSIQLPIYVVCLSQQFAREGRPAAGAEAFYLAFGDRRAPVQSAVDDGPRAGEILEDAQCRALQAVDGIERGEFPPRPSAPRLCSVCAYASVCRKDYVVAD